MAITEASGVISSNAGAKLLMITPTWFRKLVRDGWIPKVGRDSYALVAVVQGFIKYRDDVERRASKSAAVSRVQDEGVRKLERENAVAEGLLMPTSESLAIFVEIHGALKCELDGVAARCTRDLELRRQIQAALDEALTRAADKFEKMAAKLKKAGK